MSFGNQSQDFNFYELFQCIFYIFIIRRRNLLTRRFTTFVTSSGVKSACGRSKGNSYSSYHIWYRQKPSRLTQSWPTSTDCPLTCRIKTQKFLIKTPAVKLVIPFITGLYSSCTISHFQNVLVYLIIHRPTENVECSLQGTCSS